MRVTHQPLFIIHHRPYRETSMILDVFTKDYGRLALIARGVRKNRSNLRSILQPFNPLQASFMGKSELLTLQAVETIGEPVRLQGDCLLSAFYLNELLMRLLPKQDALPQLYTIYHHTLLELQGSLLKQSVLRLFEKHLLKELGYGLQLHQANSGGTPLKKDELYRFYPEEGFLLCDNPVLHPEAALFKGEALIALAEEVLNDHEILKEIKRLMRMALGPLLGDKPLHSRKLFK